MPDRTLSSVLRGPRGEDVVLIEVASVAVGQTVQVRFEGVNSPWRQGLWIATDGLLDVNGTASAQLVLWSDTVPEVVDIEVRATDGLVRFYNVWDSGRGRRPYESQSLTSGMLVENLENGLLRYQCNDIGRDPDFTKLRFTMQVCA